MKKTFEKITSISLAIISLLFIILIVVLIFNPDLSESFQDALVRAFIIILASAFLVLTGLNIYSSFADNERLSNVLLFKDRESATKATVGVVKKTAKRVTKDMEIAKIRKVTLFTDSSGNITLNIEIKLKTDDTMSVITNVRALIIETFKEIFKIEFSAINFRIIKSKNQFVPQDEVVAARIEEIKATIVPNKPLDGVQKSVITGLDKDKLADSEKEFLDEESKVASSDSTDEDSAKDNGVEEESTTDESEADSSDDADEVSAEDIQATEDNGVEEESTTHESEVDLSDNADEILVEDDKEADTTDSGVKQESTSNENEKDAKDDEQ